MKRWSILKRGTAFSAKIFSVDNLECAHPDGMSHTFSVLKSPDCINIVPVTEDGRIILVRQHRLGNDTVTVETPGGIIDDGEDALDAAKRELREETGYVAGEIVRLRTLQMNPAIMNSNVHFFLAKGCVKEGNQQLDREEDIEVLTADIGEVGGMIRSGEIAHVMVIAALSQYAAATNTDISFIRN